MLNSSCAHHIVDGDDECRTATFCSVSLVALPKTLTPKIIMPIIFFLAFITVILACTLIFDGKSHLASSCAVDRDGPMVDR